MRIKKIELKNFKRFSDLVIGEIPETSKLVLLIGSNGSGKSCLFDAFDWLKKSPDTEWSEISLSSASRYYYKIFINSASFKVELYENLTIDKIKLHENLTIDKINNRIIQGKELVNKFIGRSSIRIVPRITNEANISNIKSDADRPNSYIDQDERFNTDAFTFIEQISSALREPVFQGKDANTLQIFKDFIEPLNNSLRNIFGENEKTSIRITQFEGAKPNKPANLIFKKGGSEIGYELLSHGEKQVIILLINFIVRKESYQDSIIFIDEMDCHLNTALQYSLLKEITERWIPNSSQFWTASHALGFIDYAKKSTEASIIDFDLLDFDQPQTLFPMAKDDLDVYEIAIPKAMLFEIMKSKKVIFCENQNDEYYNLLGLENKIFVGVRDARDVFLKVKNDDFAYSIRDRDFFSDDEIAKIKEKYPNHNILKYRNFENYLYHPNNIAELGLQGFDESKYAEEITKQKNAKYQYLLTNVESSRKTYEEFKTDDLQDEGTISIVDDFKSDDFEKFYKFFDMKKDFNKSTLARFNLSTEKLCQTKWFKDQIASILK